MIVVAVLVLGGAGAGVYFFLIRKDEGTTSANQNTPAPPVDDGGDPDNDSANEDQAETDAGASDPAVVQQAYVQAYLNRQFSAVVNSACEAYKAKFGTDTRDLERRLTPYDIKAMPDGEPEVLGSTATAKIDLELTKDAEVKKQKIKIKIVKESGLWKFCGEGEA